MRGRGSLLLAVLALSTPVLNAPAFAEEPFSYAATPGPLPKHTRPLAYRIELMPDLEKLATADGKEDFGFAGKVEIDIEVLEPTDSLTLNTQALSFGSVSVDGAPAKVTLDAKAQTAHLQLPSRLATGRHRLAATYAGKVTSDPTGLYYMKYDTPQGERRMLSTQMQPGYARRMFPGWDEPVFKATFTLTAVVPASFRAVSNTPVAKQEEASVGKRRVSFGTTPVMSSYLVVLVAGELARLQRTVNGIDLGVIAPQDRVETGRYALDTSAQVLGYLTDYFGIPFPLPKLDHIAVPGGIDTFSAMENWGASTYVENVLLFDPATSSQQNREEIFTMLAHETAHQWFGNLVTPAWWDNLWLNEGFATWMERKVSNHFNPTWKIALRAHETKEYVMRADALRTSHAVQQDIADSEAARTAFDAITYDKGYSFIRMLEAFVGEDKFRTGLRAYMRKHAYKNTTTADLWAALTAASGLPVAEIAGSFIDQPGIPLVKLAIDCQAGETIATLTQERFSLNNPYAEKRVWQVPVVIGRPGDGKPAQSVLIGGKTMRVSFPGCGKPVKANIGNAGYYRVQYDDAAFRALAANFRQLDAADRVNLLADSWGMAQADRAGIGQFLDLTTSLKDETELVVWQSVTETLRQVDRLMIGTPGRGAYHAYVRDLVRPLMARVGWEPRPDDSAETLLLRVLAIETLGHYRDADVIAEARRRFALFVQKPESLNPELQDPVANVVGMAADRDSFNTLLKMARGAKTQAERTRYYTAVAGVAEPALGVLAVEALRIDDMVPSGRLAFMLYLVTGGSDEPDRIWAAVLGQQQALLARATESERENLLAFAARQSANPDVAFQLKWAEASRASKGARFEADKSADFIELRAEIKPRIVPAIDAWLKAR